MMEPVTPAALVAWLVIGLLFAYVLGGSAYIAPLPNPMWI